MDREVLHVLPQDYIIDEQDGIKEPLGMSGVRLEAKVHIVTGAVTSAQNIVKCCNRSGLNVAEIVSGAVGRRGSCVDAKKSASWVWCWSTWAAAPPISHCATTAR